MADESSYSIVPAEAGYQERNLVPPGVSVIYVSVDEAQPRACEEMRGLGPLRAAARAMHHMADRVDDVRRSLERYASCRRM
jgi:hypothetical protein